jgi:malate dehydrogenase (oxaloacetate-decarboxylating)(NADP+)
MLLELADKKIEDTKVVVSGAGSAALALTVIYMYYWESNPANITMFDKDGVCRRQERTYL